MVVTTRSHALSFNTTSFKDILLVQLPSRLSVVEAVPFRSNFQGWVQQDPCPSKIILDFSQTTLMDSSGIGSLLGNLKTARSHNIELILWSLSPQVNLALSLAGLDQLLTIEAHTEATIPIDTRSDAHAASFAHPSVRSPLKRTIDVTTALVGLGILGLVLIPIAIAIKLESPGPVFVGQQRCGLMGRRFYLWGFRVRVDTTEAIQAKGEYPLQRMCSQNENDWSMTWVGQFLCKSGLGTLPQFWNMLKGELSLVGPRPPTIAELDQYEIDSWQCLDVKPGLIGVLQINEQTKAHQPNEVIQLDLRYQENWSLLYDLRLILKRCLWFFKNIPVPSKK